MTKPSHVTLTEASAALGISKQRMAALFRRKAHPVEFALSGGIKLVSRAWLEDELKRRRST